MSNIIQPNLEQIEKQKYLDLLGSPEFPQILKTYKLDFMSYNEIFSSHVLMIALQTTSVREGVVYLEYFQNLLVNSIFSNITPKLKFYFTLTNHSVISRDNSCTNSSVKTHHKKHSFIFNSYGRLKEYRSPREFRAFLVSYEKEHLKMANDQEHALFESFPTSSKHNKFKVHVSYNGKVSQLEKLEHLYHEIIECNPALKNFLQFHFLQELHINTSISIKKNKL